MQLFLDCDGVLANFDKRAEEALGMNPRLYEKIHGTKKFWDGIYSIPDFFFTLEPMDDAYELVHAVEHLNPIILTGKPKGEWGREQKLRWRDKYFPKLEMIVCQSKDKIKHAKAGDVLVDDWTKYKQVWIDGGGIWVDHVNARTSIVKLKQLGIPVLELESDDVLGC